MGLSSNTLIHLTSEKQSLIGIIKEGFKLKYCNEHLQTKSGQVNAAFPMVSFSDIPLSELGYHIDSYGNYGIGLKKSWAKRKGLNPVLYFDDSSSLGATIRRDFKDLYDKIQQGKLDKRLFEASIEILSYSKNYEGKLKTSRIERDSYRFSDEREWRFVPSKEELKGAFNYVGSSKYRTEEQKKDANQKLNHLRLTFEPDDINYLFVENESEIAEIVDEVRKANSSQPFSSVERLLTRIMTTEQIKTDI